MKEQKGATTYGQGELQIADVPKAQGIAAENLSVGYGGKAVLSDVTLQVKPGQILTLVGPNGSGKSTILKTITRQLKRISGSVAVMNRDMDDITGRELARMMSMVMTERLSPELMTCRDVVSTGRYPYTGRFGVLGSEDCENVERAMQQLHISDVADRLFTQISDGQRQLIMLARALCQEPQILILDEPTSFLDMRYKLEILSSIRRMVQSENLAVVMSLHELDLAQKVSDIVACVDGSTVSAVGTPEEIFSGDVIWQLYHVRRDAFAPTTGSMFLPRTEGEPRVFVIGGGGQAIPFFYALQRRQLPFAVGILNENDVEWESACALANRVISQRAFYPIEESQISEAESCIDACESCVCTIESFGPLNEANRILKEYAMQQGKLVERGDAIWQR